LRDKRLAKRPATRRNVPYLFHVRNMFFPGLGTGLFRPVPGAVYI
jgi:hypothetical protein